MIHGDFKFNNIIVDSAGESLVAVVDWERATVGDPLLDVAHVWAATWATTPKEYGGVLGVDLAAASLPGPQEYEVAYRQAGGRPVA